MIRVYMHINLHREYFASIFGLRNRIFSVLCDESVILLPEYC
jgi:hypothetical protein